MINHNFKYKLNRLFTIYYNVIIKIITFTSNILVLVYIFIIPKILRLRLLKIILELRYK